MKKIITLLLITLVVKVNSQTGYIAERNNPVGITTDRYVQKAGTPINLCRVIERNKDSIYHRFMAKSIVIDCLTDSIETVSDTIPQNDGIPTNIIWAKGNGTLQISPVSELTLNINQSLGLQDSLNLRPKITYYNLSGTVTPTTKVLEFTDNPSSANGYSINISSAGFNSIKHISITCEKNSSSSSDSPTASIKSFNNSQLILNIVEGGSFANITGLTIHVKIEGY